eukprot:CAMPEP_0194385290 /NCGR_PEP_ID=MMETSP0174-20130528/79315_1 /TAXON_ID=216777 /ORGANISM="Proboscia alata, Strain PI-D3" /LENGTH=361 /DNA_ID=CAMNT_0039173255 /DNA_START=18 /DNA_END=1103 /DNA_ORIENTATION=+
MDGHSQPPFLKRLSSSPSSAAGLRVSSSPIAIVGGDREHHRGDDGCDSSSDDDGHFRNNFDRFNSLDKYGEQRENIKMAHSVGSMYNSSIRMGGSEDQVNQHNAAMSLPPPRAPFLSSREVNRERLSSVPLMALPESAIYSEFNDRSTSGYDAPYGSLRNSHLNTSLDFGGRADTTEYSSSIFSNLNSNNYVSHSLPDLGRERASRKWEAERLKRERKVGKIGAEVPDARGQQYPVHNSPFDHQNDQHFSKQTYNSNPNCGESDGVSEIDGVKDKYLSSAIGSSLTALNISQEGSLNGGQNIQHSHSSYKELHVTCDDEYTCKLSAGAQDDDYALDAEQHQLESSNENPDVLAAFDLELDD